MKWLRLYDDLLDDPKAQQLSPVLFKHWINLLCLSSKTEPRGTLPNVSDIAFRLRLTEGKTASILNELRVVRLLDVDEAGTFRPHNWEGRQRVSDNVADRVRKHRESVSGNDSVTLQKRTVDTDTDTDPKPETETHDEGLPTGDAPQADAKPAPQPTAAKTSKPRTAAQQAGDALYARRMAIFEAYCRGVGIDLDGMAARQRKETALKSLIPAILDTPECTPAIVEPLARYAAAGFAWRESRRLPSLSEVLAAFPDWENDGRADHPIPKAKNGHAPPGRNMAIVNGQRNLSSADLRRRAMGEPLDEPA